MPERPDTAPPPGGDIDDEVWAAAVAALLADWPQIATPLVGALAAAVAAALRTEGLAGLTGVAAPRTVIDTIATALNTPMVAVAFAAGRQAVADADAEGVNAEPAEPDRSRIGEAAAVIAGIIAAGYAASAVQAALISPAAAAAGAAQTALNLLGVAARGLVATHVQAAFTAAQHEGRRAVFAANQPLGFIADERNDRSRCAPCGDIDGRFYRTLAEALADYPFAGYRACQGGIRCRGQIRATWQAPLAESLVEVAITESGRYTTA